MLKIRKILKSFVRFSGYKNKPIKNFHTSSNTNLRVFWRNGQELEEQIRLAKLRTKELSSRIHSQITHTQIENIHD